MVKKIIVKQNDIKDCGACCLLSIIRFYNGNACLEDLKTALYTNKNGTTAYHIIKTAFDYGFEAYGIKTNIDSILNGEVLLPYISHCTIGQLNHFIVVYEVDKKHQRLKVMDPDQGMKWLTINEFKDIFTNVVITLNPINEIPNINQHNNIISLFFNLIPKEKSLIIKLLITSFSLITLNIITAFYFKIAINSITNYQNKRMLLFIIFLFFILTLIKIIFTFLKSLLENYLNKNIDIRIFQPFFNHLLNLPLGYTNAKTSGEILSRVSDLNNLKELFAKVMITILLDLFLALVAAIVLIKVNSTLSIVLGVMLVLYTLFGMLINKPLFQKIKTNIEYETAFNAKVSEVTKSFLTIKNTNRIKYFLYQIENYFCKYLEDTFLINKMFNYFLLGKSIIDEVGLFIINSFGFYLIINNRLTVIDLITFNSILIYIHQPIKNTIDLFPKISYLKASYQKINDFLSVAKEDILDGKKGFKNGDIEVKKLNYSYNNYHLLLNNLSFKITMSSKVFINGPSGCGKTSFCKLLYRLYSFDSGEIIINGINIKDYGINTIRQGITYLAQNEILYSDTIKNNIVLNRDVSITKLQKIIKICHLDTVINSKPFRLDTLLSSAGENISGGERQRIMLARALLKPSAIIILDEALSEVDYTTEQEIIKNINNYFKQQTIIYISHRDQSKLFDQVINFNQVNYVS